MQIKARNILDQQNFDAHYAHKILRILFPKKNDCASFKDLEDVFAELKLFHIITKKQLRLLLKKHRRCLLNIEKEKMDLRHERLYREDLGDQLFLDKMRRQYWFCYPALIRIALELEFGNKYENFSNARDHT